MVSLLSLGCTGSGAPQPVPAAKDPAPTPADCPTGLGGTLRGHHVIPADCTNVQITDDLAFEGGSLTVEAGAKLWFAPGTGLSVGEREPTRLTIKGTADAPVVFSARGKHEHGAWKGVAVYAHAGGSTLEHLVIEDAGADKVAALYIEAPDVTFTGSTLRRSETGVLVERGGRFKAFTGNTLTDLHLYAAITLPPDAVGGLGPDNTFGTDAFVSVQGDKLGASAKWQPLGAPLVIGNRVTLAGTKDSPVTLELVPGTEIRFEDNAGLIFGASGVLHAKGRADAPITFTAHRDHRPGMWAGIHMSGGEATFEHAILEFGGGGSQIGDRFPVLNITGGTVSVSATTLRSNRKGVALFGLKTVVSAFTGNKFEDTKIPLSIGHNLVGSIGPDNEFGPVDDTTIEIQGKLLDEKATWRDPGVPFVLNEELRVQAELTVDAGVDLRFAPTASVTVGTAWPAALIMNGAPQAPVTLGPADRDKPTWPGITLHETARGNIFKNVVITGAANPSAIDIKAPIDATLDHVTCSRCAGAVVGWTCGATVTSADLQATDGTPKTELKPGRC